MMFDTFLHGDATVLTLITVKARMHLHFLLLCVGEARR